MEPKAGLFQFTRPTRKLDGAIYRIWISYELVSWAEQLVYTESFVSIDSDQEIVEVGIDTKGKQRLFVRVSVE